MRLPFSKMNGAGNDFVMIDNRDLSIELSKEQISTICDRHRGVGADGLLAVEPGQSGADFRFRYYNADGGEAEMCGNGARCFGRYTARLLNDGREEISFETIAGILTARLMGEEVEVTMSEPFDLDLNSGVSVEDLQGPVHILNTGVLHALAFVDDLVDLDVLQLGAAIRHHDHFPNGTNANFVKEIAPGHIAIRTYERGVEDETLACGTGMVACSIIYHLLHGEPAPIKVSVRGGETLRVGFEGDAGTGFRKVTLTGPAAFVFEGEIKL
ncbi:MAG: diaminopimelate epimerase [Roseibacillus sp.]|nr:diaminopimelate epimerase [Roseibacillus sp.]